MAKPKTGVAHSFSLDKTEEKWVLSLPGGTKISAKEGSLALVVCKHFGGKAGIPADLLDYLQAEGILKVDAEKPTKFAPKAEKTPLANPPIKAVVVPTLTEADRNTAQIWLEKVRIAAEFPETKGAILNWMDSLRGCGRAFDHASSPRNKGEWPIERTCASFGCTALQRSNCAKAHADVRNSVNKIKAIEKAIMEIVVEG